MILFFSDLHFGIRSYSQQMLDGTYTAENEARIALQEIYERISSDDITAVIFGGDWFHTNQPTIENVRYTIQWIKQVDKLGKPFFLIPGNHDASMYSNSLVFIDSLVLNNTFLVKSTPSVFSWEGWNVHLLPYVYSSSMQSKDKDVTTSLVDTINHADNKSIIVSHIHESAATIGSESYMISKSVDLFDANICQSAAPTILLLGHIHKFQTYTKGNTSICYSGNTFYHDASDCNLQKGYCLVDSNGNITFEPVKKIRRFLSFTLMNDDLESISKSRSLQGNEVVFITKRGNRSLEYELKLTDILNKKGSTLGGIRYVESDSAVNFEGLELTKGDPFLLFKSYLENADIEYSLKDQAFEKGAYYLEKSLGSLS